jgi:hypothetical protein
MIPGFHVIATVESSLEFGGNAHHRRIVLEQRRALFLDDCAAFELIGAHLDVQSRLARLQRLHDDFVRLACHRPQAGQRRHLDPLARKCRGAELIDRWAFHVDELHGGRQESSEKR